MVRLGDFFKSLFSGGGKGGPGESPQVRAPGSSIPRAGRPSGPGVDRRGASPPRRPGELYQPGDVIGGQYEIGHKLGEGGFGIVYLGAVAKLTLGRWRVCGNK